MKKLTNILTFALIFALFATLCVNAAVDESAYYATGDGSGMSTNIPDSEIESRSLTESDGVLESVYDGVKDDAESLMNDVKGGLETAAGKVEGAMKDEDSSVGRTLGIVMTVIAAVAVIICVIVVASRKNSGPRNDGRGPKNSGHGQNRI